MISGREIFKIRDIERICHTTIRERKIPTPADITRVKSGKLFAEAMEIMEQKELSQMRESIQLAAEKNGFSVLDLAAAFMQMNMGDEPEEIKEEKPFAERSRKSGRGHRNDRGDRNARSDRNGREGRGGRAGRGERTFRNEKPIRGERSGRKERTDRNTKGTKGEKGFLSKRSKFDTKW